MWLGPAQPGENPRFFAPSAETGAGARHRAESGRIQTPDHSWLSLASSSNSSASPAIWLSPIPDRRIAEFRIYGTVVHHNALSPCFHYMYFLSVSIRNHIVIGFNPYPDETCRARHRHHPLVSDRIPRFGSSVQPPQMRVTQARCGHPAATNSKPACNRTVSRAPDSRPTADLNSVGLNNLSISATQRASSARGAAFAFR